MKVLLQHARWLAMAVLLAAAGAGCSTTDEIDNTSSRPWNQPRGFDVGLPGFNEQFR